MRYLLDFVLAVAFVSFWVRRWYFGAVLIVMVGAYIAGAYVGGVR